MKLFKSLDPAESIIDEIINCSCTRPSSASSLSFGTWACNKAVKTLDVSDWMVKG